MLNRVTVIDYGMCNLLNVARALEHCGAAVTISDDPATLRDAGHVVLPGVGAFAGSMHEVVRRGFAEPIRQHVRAGKPLFGICVGMQMLFDVSEEFGEHPGLGILPGRVRAVPSRRGNGEMLRVPHIGWNHLVRPDTDRSWRATLLTRFEHQEPAVYFVHSFAAEPQDARDRLADCVYGGHRICAAVQRENIVTAQFHPERSGEVGLQLLREFLAHSP